MILKLKLCVVVKISRFPEKWFTKIQNLKLGFPVDVVSNCYKT